MRDSYTASLISPISAHPISTFQHGPLSTSKYKTDHGHNNERSQLCTKSRVYICRTSTPLQCSILTTYCNSIPGQNHTLGACRLQECTVELHRTHKHATMYRIVTLVGNLGLHYAEPKLCSHIWKCQQGLKKIVCRHECTVNSVQQK